MSISLLFKECFKIGLHYQDVETEQQLDCVLIMSQLLETAEFKKKPPKQPGNDDEFRENRQMKLW